MPKDLLYEIGVEEIPASFVLPALEQLEAGLRDGLAKLRLDCGDIRTYGTPRRLAVTVQGVSERQPDIERETKGPPSDKAFDAGGQPTRAAEGFAAKCGVTVEALELRDTDKGSWVFAKSLERGDPAEAVLPGLLEAVTVGLSFPKTMRWADLDLRFARPIRWLVALLGDRVLDLEIAGVKAGSATRGHRVLGSSAVELAGAEGYVTALRASFVLADVQERREAIRRSAEGAARAAEEAGNPGLPEDFYGGYRVRFDEELLTELAFLVEWPTCLWGLFDPRFLVLPEPVIETVLHKHQRYFTVENVRVAGALLQVFVAVRNGGEEGLETVRAGNEKVITARLADAEFYLTEDLKHPLEERVASLARVSFMEGLGTLADKTARLEKLVAYLAEHVPGLQAAGPTAGRAAHLSKADLVTLMVGDSKLGDLQGVIGGEYALRQPTPESPAVAEAIAEQYRPRGAGDALPQTPAGTLLSLADKLDNLAACFRLGQIPSGSTDPFALRRQAQGVMEMVAAGGLHLDLGELVGLAISLLPEPQPQRKHDAERLLGAEAAAEALMAFFVQRLDHLLTSGGVTYDLSRAVLSAPWRDPLEVYQRGRFLQELRVSRPGLFDALVTAAERPGRISRPEELPPDLAVNPALFSEEWESRLWNLAQETEAAVDAALAGDPPAYGAAVQSLTALADPIHQFFATVMVMVEEEQLRLNRLAMMQWLDRLFLRLADFLQIVREGA